jgi:lipoic acid synthetase
MLLGGTCTRHCRFCNVMTGNPKGIVDKAEPEKLLEAVGTMELTYVVLTMVDRDDIPDGGASHVAKCIQALKKGLPNLKIEMLTGDFSGNADSIARVLDSGIDVFAHNIETTRTLSPSVRDKKCGYDQTLSVLRAAHKYAPKTLTKSSIMLGLGEKHEDVDETLRDLRSADVSVVTLGQYLRPSMKYLPVHEYVTPEVFDGWQRRAEEIGFLFCASGPLVRSSYRAGELFLENHLREQVGAPGAAQ